MYLLIFPTRFQRNFDHPTHLPGKMANSSMKISRVSDTEEDKELKRRDNSTLIYLISILWKIKYSVEGLVCHHSKTFRAM
jgi:hypothetical protein